MSGNTLGENSSYMYTADDGSQFNVTVPDMYGLGSDLGWGAADPALFGKPKGFKLRFIWVQQSIYSGSGRAPRKKIPCGSNTAGAYVFTTAEIAINTVDFTVKSRHGEKRPGGV